MNPNGLLLVDGVQREPTKANRERIKDRKCTTYDALEQEVFLFWSFQDLSQLTDRYCEAWYSVLSDTPYVPNWKLLQSNSQIRKDATEVLFKKNQIRLLSIRAARPFFFDAGLNRNFIRDLYMKVPVVGRWGQKVQVPSHYDSLFRYMASGMLPGLKILTIAICDGLLRWRWDENLTSTHLAYPLVSQLGTIQNLEKLTVECQHFTPPTEVVAVDLERDIEVYLTCMMCGVDVLNSSDEDTANRARAMGSLLEPEVEDSEEEDDEYACHEAY